MDRKDWLYIGAGTGASAGIVGLVALLARKKGFSGSGGGSAGSGSGGGSAGSGSGGGSAGSGSGGGSTPPLPVAPTGLKAQAKNGVVTVTWAGVSAPGPNGATVTYTVTNQTTGQPLAQDLTKTSYAVHNLTVGQHYTFAVKACGKAGCGPSATVSLTVPTIASQTITPSQASAEPGVSPTPQDQYGDSLSGKISPSQARQLYQQGQLPGPGFVVDGEWFQNLDQIPASLRAQAQVLPVNASTSASSQSASSGSSAPGPSGSSGSNTTLPASPLPSSEVVSSNRAAAKQLAEQKAAAFKQQTGVDYSVTYNAALGGYFVQPDASQS